MSTPTRPPISREEIQRTQAENQAKREEYMTRVIYDACVREINANPAAKFMRYNITDCIGAFDLESCRMVMKAEKNRKQVVEALKSLFPGCDIIIMPSSEIPDYKGIAGEILTISWA
jgi:hypothetical protein